MVAKITCPFSIKRVLNYNEKKVEKGVATCIHAANYLQDLQNLNFYKKLDRFEKLISLNSRAKTNTLHISLNFDQSEKFAKEKLIEIANTYMTKIGFGQQPYLVYEHRDAGHPHIHIVTTNIQSNGKRINTFNIGKLLSEPARKEIELTFGLVQASKKQYNIIAQSVTPQAQKLQYGKSETRRSITNVLDTVLKTYKYSSLAELNAVLKLYNVVADRGAEDSSTYEKRGLFYRMLDQEGNKIGVPIKASSIYSKPTLDSLEKRFKANTFKKQPDLQKLKSKLDWTLVKPPATFSDFVRALEKERVHVTVRANAEGRIFGLTYIDHSTKAVFNGSDLGKEYSAKAVLDRCKIDLNTTNHTQNIMFHSSVNNPENEIASFDFELNEVIVGLFDPLREGDYLPSELKKNKKKQRAKKAFKY